MSTKEHWNKVYKRSDITELGWFEESPQPSLDLINRCGVEKDAVILDIGSGASILIEKLIEECYRNITAVDISDVALAKARERLDAAAGLEAASDPGRKAAETVRWIVDDITDAKNLRQFGRVDIWHDRTVLHFLTEERQREGYVNTLKALVKPGGYVIIAVFSLEGAKKCSGLDVRNYDHEMIARLLGDEFDLLEHLEYEYIQPSGGIRPFVYTRFQRSKEID